MVLGLFVWGILSKKAPKQISVSSTFLALALFYVSGLFLLNIATSFTIIYYANWGIEYQADEYAALKGDKLAHIDALTKTYILWEENDHDETNKWLSFDILDKPARALLDNLNMSEQESVHERIFALVSNKF